MILVANHAGFSDFSYVQRIHSFSSDSGSSSSSSKSASGSGSDSDGNHDGSSKGQSLPQKTLSEKSSPAKSTPEKVRPSSRSRDRTDIKQVKKNRDKSSSQATAEVGVLGNWKCHNLLASHCVHFRPLHS